MSHGLVGERYARAIYELAEESDRLDAITNEVTAIADVFAASEDLRSVLDNPLVPEPRREAVLAAIAARLGLGSLVVNLVRLMARRHRMAAMPDVARSLRVMADRKAGVVRATVCSATPLTESDVRQLVTELEQKTKQRVVLETEHDPSLIAGLVTRIGDKTIDGSLKGRLEAIERRLLQS